MTSLPENSPSSAPLSRRELRLQALAAQALAAQAETAQEQAAPTPTLQGQAAQDEPVAQTATPTEQEDVVVVATPEPELPEAVTVETPGAEVPEVEIAVEPITKQPAAEQLPPPAEPAADEAPHTAPRGKNRAKGRRARKATAAGSTRPVRSMQRATKTTGAAFAIGALVVGTALPAIGLVRAADGNAATTASDIRAQSFTAAHGVLPDVQVHGTFTATTPNELSAMKAATAAAARTGVASIAKPGQVIYPMAAGSYTLTDGFGAARTGRSHMGQDFAAPAGTPIYAVADGCVTMSQESYQGYGVAVEVAHPALSSDKAVSTLYGHMEYGTRAVQVGECVTAGQFLGRVGDTGWTVGTCLHLEVHINDNPIDPLAWLEANVF